jgi:hypothetical protein
MRAVVVQAPDGSLHGVSWDGVMVRPASRNRGLWMV